MTVTRRRALALLGSSLAMPALLRLSMAEAATPQLVKLGPLRTLDSASQAFDFNTPILGALPAGGFVAAWTRSGDFLPFSTRLRYYHVDGTVNGAPLILTDASGWGVPVVNADGSALVVYAKGPKIFGQKMSTAHGKAGAPVPVSTFGNNFLSVPVAIRLKNGNIAVAWKSTEGNSNVRGRVVSKVGTGISADAPIAVSVVNAEEPVGIAALAGGGYVVGYRVQVNSSSTTRLVVQRFTAAGVKTGAAITLKTYPFQRFDRIGLGGLANGGFVAFWIEDVNFDRVIKGRFFSATGTPGTVFLAPHFKKHDQLAVNPKVVVRANGQMVVFAQAAIDFTFSSYNDSVVAHLFGPTGAHLGTPLQLEATTTSFGVGSTDLVQQKDGTLVAGWSRNDDQTGHDKSFVQRVRVT